MKRAAGEVAGSPSPLSSHPWAGGGSRRRAGAGAGEVRACLRRHSPGALDPPGHPPLLSLGELADTLAPRLLLPPGNRENILVRKIFNLGGNHTQAQFVLRLLQGLKICITNKSLFNYAASQIKLW